MGIGVMMMLGSTIFSVNTTTYNQLVETANFNWQSQAVIGRQPVYQYLGHGEKTISLTGQIYPGQFGSRRQLIVLKQSAGLGLPLPLFTGDGLTLGAWCVKKFTETNSELIDNGEPRKIDFTLELVQYAGLADFLTQKASNYINT